MYTNYSQEIEIYIKQKKIKALKRFMYVENCISLFNWSSGSIQHKYNTIQNHIFFNNKVQFIDQDILNTKKTLITLIKKLNAEFWKMYLQTKPRERPT